MIEVFPVLEVYTSEFLTEDEYIICRVESPLRFGSKTFSKMRLVLKIMKQNLSSSSDELITFVDCVGGLGVGKSKLVFEHEEFCVLCFWVEVARNF